MCPKRYFEDLIEGEHLPCNDFPMTRDAIIEFAKEFDPQPFHTDDAAAEKSIYNGLIASSLHTLSACTRAVVEAQGEVAIQGVVGMDEVMMFNPVRPGDTLSVRGMLADLKRSRKNSGQGFARIQCKVFNQWGEPVLEYGYRYLVACKEFQETSSTHKEVYHG